MVGHHLNSVNVCFPVKKNKRCFFFRVSFVQSKKREDGLLLKTAAFALPVIYFQGLDVFLYCSIDT